MTLSQRFIGAVLKSITIILFRVDDAQLAKVPPRGPLILVTNHVHMPEIPTLFLRLTPRPVTGMLLANRWDNPLFRWMLNSFHILPLKRGEADLAGLRRGLEMLDQGYIVIIDPEGTRSHTGILQPGRAGAVLMALRSGAPLIPVVHYGSENYKHNFFRRLKRTDFHFAVGRVFRIKPQTAAGLHNNREAIVTEVMAQMAALLPPEYRGAYAGVEPTEKYLVFDEDEKVQADKQV
jgi:1-acyl-sn-glycerol-3-phosphate acyltransferase